MPEGDAALLFIALHSANYSSISHFISVVLGLRKLKPPIQSKMIPTATVSDYKIIHVRLI